MAAAPLLLGCDLDKLDDFTLNLVSNDEVLAVNQDALGKQATVASNEGNTVAGVCAGAGGWFAGGGAL